MNQRRSRKAGRRCAQAVPRRTLGLIACLSLLAGLVAGAAKHLPANAPHVPVISYRSMTCRCCVNWSNYLERHGFEVDDRVTRDHAQIHRLFGVPKPLHACHTALIEGYVIEGHVPADDIKRLLAQRPSARGLALPGMPGASPGMREFSRRRNPYEVLLFQPNGDTTVFSRHSGEEEP
ncbi:MAG: DUF411 domain-containing protein [Panacagrimonas sp.]